jgi:hypothetical protein
MAEDLLQIYLKTFSTCPGQNLRMILGVSVIGNFTERLSIEPCLSEALFYHPSLKFEDRILGLGSTAVLPRR